MKIEFVTAGDRAMGASRIRAWDLVDEWNDPNVTCSMVRNWEPRDPDVIVLQKVFVDSGSKEQPASKEKLEFAFKTGARLYWDLADPVWYWMKDSEFRAIADQMTGIVVSSPGLRQRLLSDMGYESTWIDDRYRTPGIEKVYGPNEPPMLVWFGYGRNRVASLHACTLVLMRLAANGIKFELTVIDNNDKVFYDDRLTALAGLGFDNYIPFNRHTIWTELCDCEIALLPRLGGLVGEMKSDNKQMMAKWAGLAISDGQDYQELKRLLSDASYRHAEGLRNRKFAEEWGHVSKSIAEWKQLLACEQEKAA